MRRRVLGQGSDSSDGSCSPEAGDRQSAGAMTRLSSRPLPSLGTVPGCARNEVSTTKHTRHQSTESAGIWAPVRCRYYAQQASVWPGRGWTFRGSSRNPMLARQRRWRASPASTGDLRLWPRCRGARHGAGEVSPSARHGAGEASPSARHGAGSAGCVPYEPSASRRFQAPSSRPAATPLPTRTSGRRSRRWSASSRSASSASVMRR